MKLWLVQKRDPENSHPCWGYDSYGGHVVRTDTEEEARALAVIEAGTEGETVWLDEELTTCTELTAEGEAGIVLSDFSAG